MKVAVYGAGAVGGLMATLLSQAGHDVTLLARGAAVDALRKHGLRLEQESGMTITHPRVVESAVQAGLQDVVILAVKEPALAAIAPSVRAMLQPQTLIITALNGVPWWFFERAGGPLRGTRLQSLDPEGVLAEAIPANRLLGCVMYLTASASTPGVVRAGPGGRFCLGGPGGALPDEAAALAGSFTGLGYRGHATSEIEREIWRKLWANVTINPISALTGATTHQLYDEPQVLDLCLKVMREVALVGRAIGIDMGMPPEECIALARRQGPFKTSMLQDLERGRPLEVKALLQAVQEIARLVQVPTPFLDALSGLATLRALTAADDLNASHTPAALPSAERR